MMSKSGGSREIIVVSEQGGVLLAPWHLGLVNYVLKTYPTPRIALFVRWLVGPEKAPHHEFIHQGQGSWIHAPFIPASYTLASGSRIIYKYASWIYAYLHQGQG